MMMHRYKKRKRAEENTALSFDPPDLKEEHQEIPRMTKTDINRMPVDELRKMAMNTGVEGAESMTGAELKKYLIDIFGL